jgi:parallel beta-helix repeat protein
MKRFALFLALVVATLAQRPVVAAGPYYVCAIATCPGASNANAGTFGSPWLTISYGVAHISAGETLYIRGGVYTGSTNVIDSVTGTVPNGTDLSTGAVTIAGYAGETAIIKPPSGRNAIKLTTGSPHYIIIQDLELDGSNQIDSLSESEMLYVANNSHHLRFQRLKIHDVMSGGAQFSAALSGGTYDYTFAANLELLDSEIYAVGKATGDSGHGGAGINNGYCLYSFVDNVTIRGNNCHDLPGSHGWNVYADHIVIERNISAHNGRVRAIASNSGFSICSSAYGDPPGPALPCTDILVRNNIAWDNTGDGITIYTGADGTLVYNNTAYGNSGAGIALQFYASAPTVKNNIVYGNTVAGSCNGIKDYGGTGSPVCANNLATTPSFTNATLGIFTITCPGSAACDAGVTLASVTNDILGNTRPSGSAYDIGAYEANASGTAVSITTTTLPNGTLTVGYSATIAVTGGTGTYASCTVSAGSLPTGLSASIVSNACQISGTPSAVNSFSFTIQACDNAGSPSCDTQAYTVSIVAVCTPGSSGNWSLIDCPGASSSNGTADAVSVAVNSATADFAACAVASDLGAAIPTFTDSKGNSWTLIQTTTATYGRLQLYFSRLTTTGSGHTFTAATGGAASFPAFQCVLFSGSVASPLDKSNGSTVTSTTSMQPGSMTAARAEELFVQSMQVEVTSVGSVSVSDSYTVYQRPVTSYAFGIALGWRTFSATGSSSNPTWTWAPAMGASSVGATFYSTAPPTMTIPARGRVRRAS